MRQFIISLLILFPATTHAQTLYNETLGNFPADQGWFLYLTNPFSGASQSYVPSLGTQLVTSNSDMAGYFNKNPLTGSFVNGAFPILDRAAGFRISWDLVITAETHTDTLRAGFSIIALASDSMGIELGFWANEIWAQNVGFTHGEGVAFTTTNRTHYDLNVLGNGYDLYANGVSIRNGALRDYTGSGLPYTNTSFLFLGDDTTRAGADMTLGRVSLLTAVPEPATWLGLVCVGFGVVCWYRGKVS